MGGVPLAPSKGVMALKELLPSQVIVHKIATWDFYWRNQLGLDVVWVLPYILDFLHYKRKRVRFDSPNQPVLDIYRENEAMAAPERMCMALVRLKQDLSQERKFAAARADYFFFF